MVGVYRFRLPKCDVFLTHNNYQILNLWLFAFPEYCQRVYIPRGPALIESLVYQSSSGAPSGRGCSLKLTHTNQCKFQLSKSNKFRRYIFTIVKLLLNNTSTKCIHILQTYIFYIFVFAAIYKPFMCMAYFRVKRDKIHLNSRIRLVLLKKLFFLSVGGVSFNNL